MEVERTRGERSGGPATADTPAHVQLEQAEVQAELASLVETWAAAGERSTARRAERRRARTRARARTIAISFAIGTVAVLAMLAGSALLEGGGASAPGLEEGVAPGLARGPGGVPPDLGAEPEIDFGPAANASRSAAITPSLILAATPRVYAPAAVPGPRQIAEARAFARSRVGPLSFAVVDSRGTEHGLHGDRQFVSASVVKVMLLIAEVDRLHADGLPLDPTTRSLLERMITYSDNDAADTIYYRVGDEGLFDVARRAGLERFTVSGYWANAQLTAADMAQLMARVDELLVGAHAPFASDLLERVVTEQRWGIPAAVAGDGWRQRFKGGWRTTERGQLVHQIARLDREGTTISLAVLSDGAPSMDYGIATVYGIAERLLSSPPVPRGQRPTVPARLGL